MKFASVLSLALAVPAAAISQGGANALQVDAGSRQGQLEQLEEKAEQLNRLSKLETNEGKTQHSMQRWCDELNGGSKAMPLLLANASTSLLSEVSADESEFKAAAVRACEMQEQVFDKINNEDLADLRQEVTGAGGQHRLRGAQAQAALLQQGGAGNQDTDGEDDEGDDDEEEEKKTALMQTATQPTASTAAVAVKEASAAAVTAATSKADVEDVEEAEDGEEDEEDGKEEEDDKDDEEDGADQEKNVQALLQKLNGQAEAISFMQLGMETPATTGDAKNWCAYFTKVDSKGSGWMNTVQQAEDESAAQQASLKEAKVALLQQKYEMKARGRLVEMWTQQVKSTSDVLLQMNQSIGFLKENLANQPSKVLESDILGRHKQLLSSVQEVYGVRQKHVQTQQEHLAFLEKEQTMKEKTVQDRKMAVEKSMEHVEKVQKQVASILKACKSLEGESTVDLLTKGMKLA